MSKIDYKLDMKYVEIATDILRKYGWRFVFENAGEGFISFGTYDTLIVFENDSIYLETYDGKLLSNCYYYSDYNYEKFEELFDTVLMDLMV